MSFSAKVGGVTHRFADLSGTAGQGQSGAFGDRLAGIAAATAGERMAARLALADLPLRRFLEDAVVPLQSDEGHPAHRR